MFEKLAKLSLKVMLISMCVLKITLGNLLYTLINCGHCKMLICKVGILNYLMLQKVLTFFIFVLSEENIS